jgi:hypothetical protein
MSYFSIFVRMNLPAPAGSYSVFLLNEQRACGPDVTWRGTSASLCGLDSKFGPEEGGTPAHTLALEPDVNISLSILGRRFRSSSREQMETL